MLEEVWRYKSVLISKCSCPKLLVLFIFLILFTHHILKRLITTYRVLKDKGVYFLVMLLILLFSAYDFNIPSLPPPSRPHNLSQTCCILHAAVGNIWCPIVSFVLVERVMLVDDKTPCDRLVNSYFSWHLIFFRYIYIYVLISARAITMYAEKLSCEDKPEPPIWDLTNPVPLHDDGSLAEELLGNNPDVHYIYICTKVGRSKFPILACLSDRSEVCKLTTL